MRQRPTPDELAAMTENEIHALSAVMFAEGSSGKPEAEFGDAERALVASYLRMVEQHRAMFPRTEVPRARPT